MNLVIETTGLTRVFGQVRAVDGLDLRVEAEGREWMRRRLEKRLQASALVHGIAVLPVNSVNGGVDT